MDFFRTKFRVAKEGRRTLEQYYRLVSQPFASKNMKVHHVEHKIRDPSTNSSNFHNYQPHTTINIPSTKSEKLHFADQANISCRIPLNFNKKCSENPQNSSNQL